MPTASESGRDGLRRPERPRRPEPSRHQRRRRSRLGLAAGAIGGWLALMASPALAFTVFACEPEWAALSTELMPDATVHLATQARQDPHHIEARPALIAQLRSADLAVCSGAGLEAGWLPMLIERAGNDRVQVDAPGLFLASAMVPLIDRQETTLNPFAGDIHGDGNPHVHTDPHRLLTVARRLAERMQALAPERADAVRARFDAFETRWRQRIADWETAAQPLRGQRVATQHGTFAYLWRWLGIDAVADLEPRPGLSPTPGHLQGLLKTLKPDPPLAIVIASYHDPRAGRWLADQLGGKVPLLTLPSSPLAPAEPEALDRWFDALLAPLLDAARAGG